MTKQNVLIGLLGPTLDSGKGRHDGRGGVPPSASANTRIS
jgi:hypothetical protein